MNISIGKAAGLAILAAALSAYVTAAVIGNQNRTETPAPAAAQATQPEPQAAVAAREPVIDLETAMADRILGNPDAPVTVIEYASMTCDHCAAFHNQALPEIKRQLIDSGQARLVYRDMPWDKYALEASQIARCAPPGKYFEVVEALFRAQGEWAHSTDPHKGLMDIGIAAGMDAAYLKACVESQPLAEAIIRKQQEARKEYSVNATPSFIFMQDGARLERYPPFEEIFKKRAAHKH